VHDLLVIWSLCIFRLENSYWNVRQISLLVFALWLHYFQIDDSGCWVGLEGGWHFYILNWSKRDLVIYIFSGFKDLSIYTQHPLKLPFVDPCSIYLGFKYCILVMTGWPPLWSSDQSSWLQNQRIRVRFTALPNFLNSSRSGTGFTQPLCG
jgi:hypothetical protein